ncbi:MAG: hypothetical protein UR22_C0036G0007 [Parcubacteria group bacterium GW2011_GWC2_32_10]|nr:MAG: hypothetical protein UR22_C0036G0007 [Parcubacteria group bacterium GW2011_GWC2_32_10]
MTNLVPLEGIEPSTLRSKRNIVSIQLQGQKPYGLLNNNT